MNLLLISQENFKSEEIRQLVKMFELGLEIFHLRKPLVSVSEMRNYIRRIPSEFINRVVIHDHYNLTEEFSLRGIHLSEKARREKLEFVIKEGCSISTSFHAITDIDECADIFDYVFYSPVFKSISKQNYFPSGKLEDVQHFLKRTKQNVVALGGITPSNINEVKYLGFKAVATLGFVWLSEDPVKSFVKMKEAAGILI